ncbi:MAG: PAS domain-containing sensor histidine kinase [Deltaproteobacteria bacterium]|nr:PAS domain-containing sensor histidine kinase [Deltaproteobacteria bacterium]
MCRFNNKDQKTSNQTFQSHTDLAFYKWVIDLVPVGVMTVDSHLEITGLNPRALEITGFTEQEALHRSCGDILQGGMCDMECPLRSVLKREKPMIGIETTIRRRSGETIPIRMHAAGLFDTKGNLIGGIEAFQDIRRIKSLERERDNFISMIAHDMKSPIIGIHGFAHRLLKRPQEQQEMREYLEIIQRESEKLESLINQFLEISRLQAGKLNLNLSATSLDKELHELYDTYRLLAAEKGLHLELHADEPLPIIEADSAALRRVFTNLLDNAIKYSKETGAISISTYETGNEVVVEIKDQGIGIGPADLPYIFEAFYRSTGEGKESAGFGLGLAGVKAIVERHGGGLRVNSTPGEGSTFIVLLPKARHKVPE